jgi:two-component system response regulator
MEKVSRELFIIDDNADHRYLLQQIFHTYLPDYSARFFQGGEQLYHYLIEIAGAGAADRLPAAIILDLHMPYQDGIQILKSIKQPDSLYPQCENIPVIVMTGEASEQQVSDCYAAGVNAFVKKPAEFSELKDLLSTICNFWIGLNRVPALKNS